MTNWVNTYLGFQSAREDFPESCKIITALVLRDGKEDPELIYKKLREILTYLGNGKKVIVFCLGGLSRSPSLCISILAFQSNKSWEEIEALFRIDFKHLFINRDFAYSCKKAIELLRERLVKKCKCGVLIEEKETLCQCCQDTTNME